MIAEPPVFHVFGDETSQTGHKYLVYGTVDCLDVNLSEITRRLNEAMRGRKEFKWSGELSRDLDHFVDVIFACRSNLGLSFRCVVVNTQHSDHRKYNDGDAYLGLEKYIFVHLLGYARRQHVTSKTQFWVTLDKLKDNHTFGVLKRTLNARARNELNRTYDMFAEVMGVESHTQVLVQTADVLAGGSIRASATGASASSWSAKATA